jgi:hypothetical protein
MVHYYYYYYYYWLPAGLYTVAVCHNVGKDNTIPYSKIQCSTITHITQNDIRHTT